MDPLRQRALDRIYADGTFDGGVYVGPRRVLGDGVVTLLPYQEEAIAEMTRIEERGAVVVQEEGHNAKKRRASQTLLCNVGLLSEPPLSGNSLIAIAHSLGSKKIDPKTSAFVTAADASHLISSNPTETRPYGKAAFRTFVPDNDTQRPIPYEDVDIDVIIAPARTHKRWMTEAKRMGMRAFGLNGIRAVRELQRTSMESLVSNYDAVVLHAAYSRQLDATFLGYRVNRVFVDAAGSIELKDMLLRARFVWALDPNPYNVLNCGLRMGNKESKRDHYSKSSGYVYEMFVPSLSWVLDPSMFVVRHTHERIESDAGIQAPPICVYRCVEMRARDAEEYVCADEDEPEESVERRVIIDFDATVSSMPVAVSRCGDSAAQARMLEGVSGECPICLEDKVREVVLNCCQNVICKRCMGSLSNALCPFDRTQLRDRPGCITVIDGSKPINLTYVYQSELSRTWIGNRSKANWLTSVILGNRGVCKFLIVVSDREYFSFSGSLGMATFLRHASFYAEDVRRYDNRMKITGVFERMCHLFDGMNAHRAVTMDPAANLHGCSLIGITDVLFYTKVEDCQYQNIMARVLNPLRPGLKRDGKSLRVHMFLEDGQKIPRTARMAYELECEEEYRSGIALDIASFHIRAPGIPL